MTKQTKQPEIHQDNVTTPAQDNPDQPPTLPAFRSFEVMIQNEFGVLDTTHVTAHVWSITNGGEAIIFYDYVVQRMGDHWHAQQVARQAFKNWVEVNEVTGPTTESVQ